ncbi:penicillin-binding protein activator LpoB [Thiospirochaeta perfilievii]|uniref:Penicillin-binding protein activator LpoB n=1 Tax=Thiospirochaeta perfilievii TaxID=252967 RepID=A0A5C1Q8J2_9SPIO|nr:penicillin-binding protein activator LpoB [Thiospirochaeta perfilievii]QEN03206.1 penicillin-binding protein activator LpoB [Thiospirochaeta perfilievii]
MNKIITLLFSIFLLLGCQTTNRVTRIDSDIDTDLSGRWNDTDSRLISESMINDLLNRPITSNLVDRYGKTPVLIVGTIRNRSSEHINITSFVKDIERELVNSGKFTLVASSYEREEIRNEKEDQQSNSSLESTKRLAQETGADIMLIGNLVTITDQVDKTRVVYYQVDLELIDLETNTKLWIGSKKHKKVIQLGGVKW